MSRKKRRRFTPEQRAQAIRIVRESGKSIRQVAEELDVTPSSLGRWLQQADVDEVKDPHGPLTSEERYAWRKRMPSRRAQQNEQLAAKITEVHAESRGTYGSPRVHAELRAQGCEVGRNRVARLMQERGILGRRKPRFRRTTDSNHTLPVADNRLRGGQSTR